MGAKIRLTKKGKIGIIAIVMLLLAGSGGYLLWRVNQDDTVAPTDSDASGGAGACCNSAGCVAGWECKTNIPCSSCEGAWTVGRAGPTCGTIGGLVAKCRSGFHCTSIYENTCCPDTPLGTCVKVEDPEEPIGGTCDEETKKCEWPGTIISSTCSCEQCNGNNGCSGSPPKCTPAACPSDQESCGVSGDGGMSDCTKSASCVTYHPDCNNPSNVYRYCRPKTPPPPTNTCDSGSWITKPVGTYAHCASIKYSGKGTDSNGIDESSIVVKLNNVARTNVAKVTNGTSTTMSETLSSSTNCLAPGSYTLSMKWKDKLGAESNNCSLSTTFTVSQDVPINVCDSGTWTTKPTGTYAYCSDIKFVAKATDSDGIDEDSISVKLSTLPVTPFDANTSGTTTTISGTLSSPTKCLAAGTHDLTMSWKDTLGAESENCTLNTSFTVQPQVLNPDWAISKAVVEKCIDENTANPTSQLTYTITVENTGEGEGTMTKIVDTLDTKVLQTYISGISNSGAYANGDITWTLSTTDKVFAADQSKVFTYVVTVPKDTFGTYTNTVTAYPATGENIIANANVTADCVVEAPVTGMFDSTWSKILLGVVFIAIGANYLKLSNFTKKLFISLSDMNDEKRKKNFEKKVVKR